MRDVRRNVYVPFASCAINFSQLDHGERINVKRLISSDRGSSDFWLQPRFFFFLKHFLSVPITTVFSWHLIRGGVQDIQNKMIRAVDYPLCLADVRQAHVRLMSSS